MEWILSPYFVIATDSSTARSVVALPKSSEKLKLMGPMATPTLSARRFDSGCSGDLVSGTSFEAFVRESWKD